MKDVVSIIMPAFRTAEFVAESIQSVLDQTWSDWQLVIVDDGSPDNVLEIIAPYLADPRILCRSFENGGLATARNRGLALATGRYIALLDSDDLFEPDYLETMMAYFADHPEVSIVTSDATMFGIPSREGGRFSDYEPQKGEITLDRVLERKFNILVAVTARADAIREVGGFNPSFRAAEDFDLWTRLLARGKRFGYIAQPLVRYRRRTDSLSASTVSLLLATLRVYIDRLADVPPHSSAALICGRQAKACLEGISFARGESAIREGNLAVGQALVKAGLPNPPLRWRLILWLMRYAPSLAARLLDRRDQRNTAELSKPLS